MTQDIMQLADTYADRFYLERRYHNEESVYDRVAARAALQSAVDALQAERDALAAQLKELQEQEPVGYTDNTGTAFAVKWSGVLPPNLTLYTAPKALGPLTADMFWNNDDPERQYISIDAFLNEELCQGQPVEVGAVFTIQQAKRMPNIQIKVTSINEESCEAEYEAIAALGIGGKV